jgi:hypothetical protein
VRQLLEWYATGRESLESVRQKFIDAGVLSAATVAPRDRADPEERFIGRVIREPDRRANSLAQRNARRGDEEIVVKQSSKT